MFISKANEEVKKDWLEERRNIRKHNARFNAILDELEEATLGARPQGGASVEASRSIRDYYHYEEYKKRFKVLFEFYQLEEFLK